MFVPLHYWPCVVCILYSMFPPHEGYKCGWHRSKKVFDAVKLFLFLKSVRIMFICCAVMTSEAITKEKSSYLAEPDVGHNSKTPPQRFLTIQCQLPKVWYWSLCVIWSLCSVRLSRWKSSEAVAFSININIQDPWDFDCFLTIFGLWYFDVFLNKLVHLWLIFYWS